MAKEIKHLVNNEYLTRKEASEKYMISKYAIDWRMRVNKLSLQEAVDLGSSKGAPLKIGDVIGHLTIIAISKNYNNSNSLAYTCKCKCGNTAIKSQQLIKQSKMASCNKQGCTYRISKNKFHNCTSYVNASKHPLYKVWRSMLARCENTNNVSYPVYGALGITVSAEWHDFNTFIKDVGDKPSDKHSLDRIDPYKGYSKDNCRWATPEMQAINKRKLIEMASHIQYLENLLKANNIHFNNLEKDICVENY